MSVALVIAFCLGALCGAALAALWVYRRTSTQLLSLTTENSVLKERTQQLASFEKQALQTFEALSHRTLQSSSAHLVQLTKTELDAQQSWVEQANKHIAERLQEVNRALRELEERRRENEGTLHQQLTTLAGATATLQAETHQLRAVLSHPRSAGRWGEVQLRNAIQAAGLISYCDFLEQSTAQDDESRVRPDLIVRLPHERLLIIDAKAPVQTVLSLSDEQDETARTRILKEFTTALRRYIRSTAQREYPRHFPNSVPFTLIFIPGEHLLSLALDYDPQLLTFADEQGALLCTPLSLITYLRTVALGWQERNLFEHASEIRQLAAELYQHLDSFTHSFEQVGKAIAVSVRQYNEACRLFERKALVNARRFREIEGRSDDSLSGMTEIERTIIPPNSSSQTSEP